ncbi:LutB/LldF family L-lactate oxidation iron-sulfur protein [Azospirillum doebereinerae]|uniref:Iron-sulfur cluster-binding protein n=1 Tax=Azospirillum doebereinerae TaxID=92933 RepID=A0A433J7U7_9PROT|nr:LutB/LldF family L-lactate oxidation iron-sulfur protein [Azospirillum doebereinerae]MCG5241213.1 LutB/LldF family L-lactate oxidation iron-sulfur protein [Azospirillum doebereinerae]RUQ69777.1 iron-sulfur cluster-binding protein [Azospirillum doebereinerae]
MAEHHGTEAPVNFAAASKAALLDPQLRGNFRRAMDGLMTKRAVQFADAKEWHDMRALAASVRLRALSKLPELLEKLEANCTRNGIQVHWASTTDEANAIVLDIMKRVDAKLAVKGKSMVTEEMHLNAFLEEHGIEALEADLGEYIVQLDGTMPSHIIMPAIHLNTKQIAHLFKRKIKEAESIEDAAYLTGLARRILRQKFMNADVGMSGVNAAVAETGTLCLIENEGNGRMCTTVPPVHIAFMGLEKVVETLEDVPPVISLLPRSATGQPITTYVNMITSPRKEGELDGPREIHLVILDNGRSSVYADAELRDTLRCIRCGACMNHCPVYTKVGGHAYEAPYPGPIGKILVPQMEGLAKRGEMPHACTMCNACVEICPVKIPIVEIMGRLRVEAVRPGDAVKDSGAQASKTEAMVWKGWAAMNASPMAYKIATMAMSKLGNAAPTGLPLLKEWTSVRTKPRFASRTLHDLAREKGIPDV